MADAIRGWYNEVKMGQLRFAGHYTQLAWANTEELGCGIVVYKVGTGLYVYLHCRFYIVSWKNKIARK